jgi:hypothetical protein
MKHDIMIEQRYFSKDIEALMLHDDKFKDAYENGGCYRMEITLGKLAEICPRKFQKKQMYHRLVSFLELIDIQLVILSKKKDKAKINERIAEGNETCAIPDADENKIKERESI